MTPTEGKDSDSNNSKKSIYNSYVLTCSIDSFGFFLFSFFFFCLFSPSVVVVDFIGTMKSN